MAILLARRLRAGARPQPIDARRSDINAAANR
jgi:hypothetical protein